METQFEMKSKEQLAKEYDLRNIKSHLTGFTGTEHYYKSDCIQYTDGVKYLAEVCQCYWLIDIVSSYQYHKIIKQEPFQVYKLTVKDEKGHLEISEGNDIVLATQEIEYTDFPLSEMTLWCIDKILILPSEY
jgi:hypothetical protein